jgi:hypothetical protein
MTVAGERDLDTTADADLYTFEISPQTCMTWARIF